jgi:putative nucleotidyltransferase with HDIG domain
MTKVEAFAIVCEFVQNDGLRRHMLGVGTCMEAYARQYGEDPELWAVTGILHDFDWEIHPNLPDHPTLGEAILMERGVSAEIRRAILSHADFTGVTRDSLMEKALFACDELAGFLTAAAYVKPTKSIFEVEAKGVIKKMKDKGFARAVNREDITKGAAEMGLELEAHIQFCIDAMKANAEALGIKGSYEA